MKKGLKRGDEIEVEVGNWIVIYEIYHDGIIFFGRVEHVDKDNIRIQIYSGGEKNEYIGAPDFTRERIFVEVFPTKEEAYDHLDKARQEAAKEGTRGSLD